MCTQGICRGRGDTVTPLVASLVAALVNIVLDPVLMFTGGLGMAGAAGATAVATYAGCVYILREVFMRRHKWLGTDTATADTGVGMDEGAGGRTDRTCSLSPSGWRFIAVLRAVVEANASMLVRTFSLLGCWAVATSVCARVGIAHVAAHQLCMSFYLIFSLFGESPAVAGQVDTPHIRHMYTYCHPFATRAIHATHTVQTPIKMPRGQSLATPKSHILTENSLNAVQTPKP
jgi:Na+-driven multidrug efflux pump